MTTEVLSKLTRIIPYTTYYVSIKKELSFIIHFSRLGKYVNIMFLKYLLCCVIIICCISYSYGEWY